MDGMEGRGQRRVGGKEGEGGEGWGWRPERERGMGARAGGARGARDGGGRLGAWVRLVGGGELGGGGDGSGDAMWPVWRGEVAAAGRRGCECGGTARWRVRGGGIARWQVRLGGRSDCELAGAGWDLWGVGAVMGTAGRRRGWDGWPGQRRLDVGGVRREGVSGGWWMWRGE